MCRLRERPAGCEILWHRRVVPVGKVGNEVEKCAAQFHWVIELLRIASRRFKPRPAFLAQKFLSFVRCPGEHLAFRHFDERGRTRYIAPAWTDRPAKRV